MKSLNRIGIIGTGFIASGTFRTILQNHNDLKVSKILTRRSKQSINNLPQEYLTNEIEELIAQSDIVFEASGDAIYATEVLEKVLEAGLPVVTMNSELQVTTGSYLASLGYITEADGDQPGSLARLKQEVTAMGFDPLVYMNIKGFLNPNPSPADMKYWSTKQGLSLEQTVSFTDGSKLQIEQALVANGLGATLARKGMLGLEVDSIFDTDEFIIAAEKKGQPLSDYVLSASAPPGVFILAREGEQNPYFLRKLQTKQGLAYLFLHSYHLCQLEVPRTIEAVLAGAPPLLTNSLNPKVSVAAIAKHKLVPGESITRGLGSFKVRGEAVLIKDYPHHVPICLLAKAVVKRAIEPNQVITFADLDLPPTRALEVYQNFQSSQYLVSLSEQTSVFI